MREALPVNRIDHRYFSAAVRNRFVQELPGNRIDHCCCCCSVSSAALWVIHIGHYYFVAVIHKSAVLLVIRTGHYWVWLALWETRTVHCSLLSAAYYDPHSVSAFCNLAPAWVSSSEAASWASFSASDGNDVDYSRRISPALGVEKPKMIRKKPDDAFVGDASVSVSTAISETVAAAAAEDDEYPFCPRIRCGGAKPLPEADAKIDSSVAAAV